MKSHISKVLAINFLAAFSAAQVQAAEIEPVSADTTILCLLQGKSEEAQDLDPERLYPVALVLDRNPFNLGPMDGKEIYPVVTKFVSDRNRILGGRRFVQSHGNLDGAVEFFDFAKEDGLMTMVVSQPKDGNQLYTVVLLGASKAGKIWANFQGRCSIDFVSKNDSSPLMKSAQSPAFEDGVNKGFRKAVQQGQSK